VYAGTEALVILSLVKVYLCVYLYVYMSIYLNIHLSIFRSIYLYIHTHVYTYMNICISYKCVCSPPSMRSSASASMRGQKVWSSLASSRWGQTCIYAIHIYVCIYMCMYLYTYIHIYTYVHIINIVVLLLRGGRSFGHT